jgi:hypothetical protein
VISSSAFNHRLQSDRTTARITGGQTALPSNLMLLRRLFVLVKTFFPRFAGSLSLSFREAAFQRP